MLQGRTLKSLAALLALYVLLCLPAIFGWSLLEQPSSYFILFPFFTSHVLHKLGVPGMLEYSGNCGWGWCAPTPLGWAVTAVFWLTLLWLFAWGLSRLVNSARAPGARPEAG